MLKVQKCGRHVLSSHNPFNQDRKIQSNKFYQKFASAWDLLNKIKVPFAAAAAAPVPNKKVFTEQKMKSRALWFGFWPRHPQCTVDCAENEWACKAAKSTQGWSHVTTWYSEPFYTTLSLRNAPWSFIRPIKVRLFFFGKRKNTILQAEPFWSGSLGQTPWTVAGSAWTNIPVHLWKMSFQVQWLISW